MGWHWAYNHILPLHCYYFALCSARLPWRGSIFAKSGNSDRSMIRVCSILVSTKCSQIPEFLNRLRLHYRPYYFSSVIWNWRKYCYKLRNINLYFVRGKSPGKRNLIMPTHWGHANSIYIFISSSKCEFAMHVTLWLTCVNSNMSRFCSNYSRFRFGAIF